MSNPSIISGSATKLINKLSKAQSISSVIAKNWHEYLVPDCEQLISEITSELNCQHNEKYERLTLILTELQSSLSQFLQFYPKPVCELINDGDLDRCVTPFEKAKALFVEMLPLIELDFFQSSSKTAGLFYCIDPVSGQIYMAPATWLNKPHCRKRKQWDHTKYITH